MPNNTMNLQINHETEQLEYKLGMHLAPAFIKHTKTS